MHERNLGQKPIYKINYVVSNIYVNCLKKAIKDILDCFIISTAIWSREQSFTGGLFSVVVHFSSTNFNVKCTFSL